MLAVEIIGYSVYNASKTLLGEIKSFRHHQNKAKEF